MNTKKIRKDFSLLSTEKLPIYFDNACMTLKPKQVIDAITTYYEEYPACALRSHHRLSNQATEQVDKARKTTKEFLGGKKAELIYTKNTTESINLLAQSLSLSSKDKILTGEKAHNSNYIPWTTHKGAQHQLISYHDDGTLDMEGFSELMNKEVKLVSLGMTSNIDGETIPVKEVTKITHDYGAKLLLDGAQSAPHQEILFDKWKVDYFAASGHKMLGPTGTGILLARKDSLEEVQPFLVGGETVTNATYDEIEWEQGPHRYEAGLQHYAGIIGLGAACKYLKALGMNNIHKHEIALGTKLREGIANSFSLLGTQASGITNFYLEGVDPHTISLMLDQTKDIATRSGMHCAHPWFHKRKLAGSVRASLYLYNTAEEVDIFLEQIDKLLPLWKS